MQATIADRKLKYLPRLPKKVCDEINSDEWSKFVRHVQKEEERFRTRDHILDTEIESLIIASADGDGVANS